MNKGCSLVELYQRTCNTNAKLAEEVGELKMRLRYYEGFEKKTKKLETKIIALAHINNMQ